MVPHYVCKTYVQVRVVAVIYREFNREGNHSGALIDSLIVIPRFSGKKNNRISRKGAKLFLAPSAVSAPSAVEFCLVLVIPALRAWHR